MYFTYDYLYFTMNVSKIKGGFENEGTGGHYAGRDKQGCFLK